MSIITATNSKGYASPAGLAVDPVIVTVIDSMAHVLVVRREAAPEAGKLVLPGGFVPAGQSAEETVAKTLLAKTGVEPGYMEQLHTFTSPTRDERGWIPAITFLALVPATSLPESSDAQWITAPQDIGEVGFDHKEIITLGLERLKTKLWTSNIVRGLLPEKFTLNEARDIYETLSEKTYQQSNFGRDLMRAGLIEITGEKVSRGRGRPADVYRFVE